jgi:hypothetical protein
LRGAAYQEERSDLTKGDQDISKTRATAQYRTTHPLIFFTKYDEDMKICFGAEITVPVDSLLVVIGGGPERPLCKVRLSGRTVYGYICPERHEAVGEQPTLNAV